MFLKFLTLIFVPLICGLLVTLGFGAFEWDRVYGLPEKTGSPIPKFTKKIATLAKNSESVEQMIGTTNGALLMYCSTKTPENKALLNKNLEHLADVSKQFIAERKRAYEINYKEDSADSFAVSAIKACRELELAVEQKKGDNEIASLAGNAGLELFKLTRLHKQILESDIVRALWNNLSIVAEIVFVGTIGYLVSLVLTLAGLTWSCHRRAKIVEENLKSLAEGKPLKAQIKGGGDSITKIDHLVHQAAEKVAPKPA